MSFSAKDIKAAARGKWETVFNILAPALKEAMSDAGAKHHVPCPVHGGNDGFRLYPDWREVGGCVCNTCGGKSDGLATLQWINGWDFPTTVAKVAEVLGLNQHGERHVTLFPRDQQLTFRGKLIDLGMAPHNFVKGREKAFFIRLNGEEKMEVLWGQSLQRTIESAKVHCGQWLEVCKIGFREAVARNGRVYKSPIWTVRSIESPEEIAARENEKVRHDKAKKSAIDHVWSTSTKLTEDTLGTGAVLAYLKRRGITISRDFLAKCDAIRASDAMRAVPENVKYPAMISAVRDPFGNLMTLHVTFLTPDGRKAPVVTPKRVMGLPENRTIRRCAIQLVQPKRMLAVAEGIETALSVSTAMRIPCWATISAGGMKTLSIPNNVQYLLIMADKDTSGVGLVAAEALRQRMLDEGRDVFIFTPEDPIPDGAKGIDWNDVLLTKGKDGFIFEGFND